MFQEDKGNCITECLKEGYYRDNNKCKNCHSDCLTCNQGSSSDSSHCSSCKSDFLFQEDKENCVKECLKEGYYRDNNKCKTCDSDCLTCNQGPSGDSPHCSSCKNNKLLVNDTQKCINNCDITYYEKNKICFKCNLNCKSCSGKSVDNNNYCTSCNENSIFKYLVNSTNFGFNCVEKCPDNTKLDEINGQCLDKEVPNKAFWIFVFILLILFTIFVIFYIYYMCKPIDHSKEILSNEYQKKGSTELFGINENENDNILTN